MTTAKHWWTLDEWTAFGRQCQATRDRLGAFVGDIPRTKGYNAPQIDAWLAADRQMFEAMLRLENVIDKQHPGSNVMLIMHGAGRTEKRSAEPRWPSELCLSRETWIAMGREVKAIVQDVWTLWHGIREARGTRKTHQHNFYRVIGKICLAKAHLETVCGRQHPDWPSPSHVFFGPDITPEQASARDEGRMDCR